MLMCVFAHMLAFIFVSKQMKNVTASSQTLKLMHVVLWLWKNLSMSYKSDFY